MSLVHHPTAHYQGKPILDAEPDLVTPEVSKRVIAWVPPLGAKPGLVPGPLTVTSNRTALYTTRAFCLDTTRFLFRQTCCSQATVQEVPHTVTLVVATDMMNENPRLSKVSKDVADH
jgi:hypothetical protein